MEVCEPRTISYQPFDLLRTASACKRVSPCQVFGHRVIGTRDEGGRVCARRVRLGRHGERSQTNRPQQLEHEPAQEDRLQWRRETKNRQQAEICSKYPKLVKVMRPALRLLGKKGIHTNSPQAKGPTDMTLNGLLWGALIYGFSVSKEACEDPL